MVVVVVTVVVGGAVKIVLTSEGRVAATAGGPEVTKMVPVMLLKRVQSVPT